jgi:hypothetical protein
MVIDTLSVASFVEASIVIEVRFGAEGVRQLDRFLDRAGVLLVAGVRLLLRPEWVQR